MSPRALQILLTLALVAVGVAGLKAHKLRADLADCETEKRVAIHSADPALHLCMRENGQGRCLIWLDGAALQEIQPEMSP